MPPAADRKARGISTLAATVLTTWRGMLVTQVVGLILLGRSSPMSWDYTTCVVMGMSGVGTGMVRITTPHHQPATLRGPHWERIGDDVAAIGIRIWIIFVSLIAALTIHLILAVTDSAL